MPEVIQKSPYELAQAGIKFLTTIRETRKEGFFFSQASLERHFIETFGIILPPENSAAVYQQVTEFFCPHLLPLSEWTVSEAIEAAIKLVEVESPHGIIAVQPFPILMARFSMLTDMVYYRLLLPELKRF